MYRQGDVLIVPIEDTEVPDRTRPAPRDARGRMILARGEATGHAHAVAGPGVALLADPEDPDRLYLRVPTYARVSHEEHGPIPVSKGSYRIIRQREYIPGAWRPVAD